MTNSATLHFPGQEPLEIPIITGSENEKALDISSLRAKSGYITLDPGFVNTGACSSAITYLDGEKGILNVDLSDKELEKRRKKWKPRETDYNSGTLWKYSQTVGSAQNGAITHPGADEETHCYADI